MLTPHTAVTLTPQKYFVGAENIVNRSDAVRSEDNLSLTDRGCNTVQCTAPHCTALYNCTAVPRTEVMMRLLTVTSPDLPNLSDTPHHDMFPALPTCRTNTVFHVYLSLDSTFRMREKINSLYAGKPRVVIKGPKYRRC